MGHSPVAGRRHVDLPRVSLRICDELWRRLGRKRWMRQHHEGLAVNARDRRYVADEIEIELVVERRVDSVGGAYQEERVSVRCRLHDGLGSDTATGAYAVLDDE